MRAGSSSSTLQTAAAITFHHSPPSSLPLPLSSGIYQFVMWFSGLRGGVAFALASVSYGDADFPQHCGGLTPEVAKRLYGMECELDDSTAMLQTTIVIAAFTIFVFGGTITDVAKASGILTDTSPEGIRLAKKEVRDRANCIDTALHTPCTQPKSSCTNLLSPHHPHPPTNTSGVLQQAH